LVGELDGVAPDRASGPVDQDALTGAQPGVLEQRLPGRQPDHGQGRGVGRVDRLRGPDEHVGRHGHVLRGCAGRVHRQERDDRVPHAPALDAFAERGDGAGDVDARYVREREREGLPQVAGADRRVDRVERRAGDPHQHLPLARNRTLGLLVGQDAAVAVLVVADCLHDSSSRIASMSKYMEVVIRFDIEAFPGPVICFEPVATSIAEWPTPTPCGLNSWRPTSRSWRR
jgi:hypothetical protein